MDPAIVEYSFSKSNKQTLVFIPGYSGGLEVPTIKELVSFYIQEGHYNVFGLNLDYQSDIPDEFIQSQRNLVESINMISDKAPGTTITLYAKSLGGSLAIFNIEKLNISKIVVLGNSITLGWPQRISLLKSKSPVVPDYKKEWREILHNLNVKCVFLCGSSDDLSDNVYLSEIATNNRNLQVYVIDNTNHNLEDLITKKFEAAQIIKYLSDQN